MGQHPTTLMRTTMPFKGYALIIAVGHYPNLPATKQLPGTINDANLICNFLADPIRAGYQPDNVRLLLDDNATKKGILDGLAWLAGAATQDSVALIFFSGHGARPKKDPKNAVSYLCPFDLDPANVAVSSISASDFSAAVSRVPAKRRVIFLDACHSGGIAGGEEHFYSGMDEGLDEATYRLNSAQGQAVFSSCKQDEKSYMTPDQQNSVFTACLVEVLGGSYNDKNRDAYVLLSDLMKGLGKEVPRRCDANPKTCLGQHPYFRIEGENFPVALISAATAAAKGITEDNAVDQQDPDNKDATGESSSERVTGLAADLLPEEANRINQRVKAGGNAAVGGRDANQNNSSRTASGSGTNIVVGDINGISGGLAIGNNINLNSSGTQPRESRVNGTQLRSLMQSKLDAGKFGSVITSLREYARNLKIDRNQLGATLPDQVLALADICFENNTMDALISSLHDNEVLTENVSSWHNWAREKDSGK
jgi:metacaspase-1